MDSTSIKVKLFLYRKKIKYAKSACSNHNVPLPPSVESHQIDQAFGRTPIPRIHANVRRSDGDEEPCEPGENELIRFNLFASVLSNVQIDYDLPPVVGVVDGDAVVLVQVGDEPGEGDLLVAPVAAQGSGEEMVFL